MKRNIRSAVHQENNPTHHLQHKCSPMLCLYATDEFKYGNKTQLDY